MVPQGHLGNVPKHTLVFSPLVTLIPDNAHAHPRPSCGRTWRRVSSMSTHSHPVLPLHCLAWPVSLLHQLAAESSLPRRELSCPPGQVSCPSPSLDSSQMGFCIVMILKWFLSATLNNELHEDKHWVLSAFHPSPGPSPGLEREEALGTISVEWVRHQPLKWAVHTGKCQKGKQNSSYEKFCRALRS